MWHVKMDGVSLSLIVGIKRWIDSKLDSRRIKVDGV